MHGMDFALVFKDSKNRLEHETTEKMKEEAKP